jgi:hypothetical protein
MRQPLMGPETCTSCGQKHTSTSVGRLVPDHLQPVGEAGDGNYRTPRAPNPDKVR